MAFAKLRFHCVPDPIVRVLEKSEGDTKCAVHFTGVQSEVRYVGDFTHKRRHMKTIDGRQNSIGFFNDRAGCGLL